MDTLKDLWASLVAFINERTTNPLTSAFVVSWSLWNYKFFVLLFSAESPGKTFAAIDALYPKPNSFFEGAFLYPLITSCVYVFAYPFLTKWVVEFYRGRQVIIANAVREVEKSRVRSVEEVNALVRLHEKKVTDMQAENLAAVSDATEVRSALKAAEEEVEKLKLQLSQLVSTSSTLDAEVMNPAPVSPSSVNVGRPEDAEILLEPVDGLNLDFDTPFTDKQLRVLTEVAQRMSWPPGILGKALGMSQFWVDDGLDQLMQRGLVKKDSSEHFSITKFGRLTLKALIAQGLWEIPERRKSDA